MSVDVRRYRDFVSTIRSAIRKLGFRFRDLSDMFLKVKDGLRRLQDAFRRLGDAFRRLRDGIPRLMEWGKYVSERPLIRKQSKQHLIDG